MADPKKDTKKPDKGGGKSGGDKGGKDKEKGGDNLFGDPESVIFWILAALALISLIYAVIKGYAGAGAGDSYFTDKWHQFTAWFTHFLVQSINTLTFISIFASIIFIMGAYYSRFRRKEIIDNLKYRDYQLVSQGNTHFGGGLVKGQNPAPGASSNTSGFATVASAGTEQWRGIEKYMQSHNPSDWRLAILEADILLYDMLEQIGFPGDTIGDKLKSIDPASFNSLDNAWRAHKVRNSLAHEGASYELTYDEARRTINQFKTVFDEFYFI